MHATPVLANPSRALQMQGHLGEGGLGGRAGLLASSRLVGFAFLSRLLAARRPRPVLHVTQALGEEMSGEKRWAHRVHMWEPGTSCRGSTGLAHKRRSTRQPWGYRTSSCLTRPRTCRPRKPRGLREGRRALVQAACRQRVALVQPCQSRPFPRARARKVEEAGLRRGLQAAAAVERQEW